MHLFTWESAKLYLTLKAVCVFLNISVLCFLGGLFNLDYLDVKFIQQWFTDIYNLNSTHEFVQVYDNISP